MKRAVNPEFLLKYIDDLEDKLVIVEGVKDSRALKSLGVKNTISLNGRPLAEFAFHVSKSCVSRDSKARKEVVILTDFDSEGKRLAASLSYLLSKYRVNVNRRLRRKFMQLGKTRIEDLKEGDFHGKVSSDFNKICCNSIHQSEWCG